MKKRTTFLILIFHLILVFSSSFYIQKVGASSSTLYPISDSYVSSTESKRSSNFGGKSYLEISYSTNIFYGTEIGYLMFSLASIPSGAELQYAKLQLYTSIVTETHTITVHYCSDNTWKEYEITWLNCPSFNAEASDTVIVAKDSEWYSWNVTGDVQTALNSIDKKLTLVVKSPDLHDTGWVWFHSRDQEYFWMETYRPKLIVDYTSPSPTLPDNKDTYIPSGTEVLVIIGVIGVFILIGFLVIRSISAEKGEKKTNVHKDLRNKLLLMLFREKLH